MKISHKINLHQNHDENEWKNKISFTQNFNKHVWSICLLSSEVRVC